MALSLHIPACICNPEHPLHLPPPDRPLRVQIEGPIISIQRLIPGITGDLDIPFFRFPHAAGPSLALLAFQSIYGREPRPDDPTDMVLRDEYLGLVKDVSRKLTPDIQLTEPNPYGHGKTWTMDYYGITFDHLVPPTDLNPEVLQINIIEISEGEGLYSDGGAYANQYLSFPVDPAEYMGKKVLAVPRCCQKRRGTTDQRRINNGVARREARFEAERKLAATAAAEGDIEAGK